MRGVNHHANIIFYHIYKNTNDSSIKIRDFLFRLKDDWVNALVSSLEQLA